MKLHLDALDGHMHASGVRALDEVKLKGHGKGIACIMFWLIRIA